MSKIDVVICHPVRTAIGTYAGTLKDLPAPSLGAAAIRECLKRSGLSGERVQSVVMGNVIQAGVRMNPSRQAAIAGGLPVEVPAMTVNASTWMRSPAWPISSSTRASRSSS